MRRDVATAVQMRQTVCRRSVRNSFVADALASGDGDAKGQTVAAVVLLYGTAD